LDHDRSDEMLTKVLNRDSHPPSSTRSEVTETTSNEGSMRNNDGTHFYESSANQ
jgi:hypothetical protein